jgi:hypothetical protein
MWNKGKHVVEEINGVRCTIVENGINENRMKFLKDLLAYNKYIVQVEGGGEAGFKIGVTDLLFNPVVDVYKRRLFNEKRDVVSYKYWFQL